MVETQMKDIQLLFPSTKSKTKNINVSDIIEKVYGLYKRPFAENKIKYNVCSTDKPLIVKTTDAVLLQVLINLLVNATKFTKEGSIVLKLEMSDRNTAFFSVTDTGCGIPLEKQELIFERFEKLNDFAQGSGLGLSICKLIVTYMKGRLWVDSNYTQGARFCFTHPLKFQSKMEDTAL